MDDPLFLIGLTATLLGSGLGLSRMLTWVAKPTPPRCRKCDYPIHDPETPACPECGKPMLDEIGLSLRARAEYPPLTTIIFGAIICWTVVGTGARIGGLVVADLTTGRGDRDAIVWIETFDAGPLARLVVASPPGLTAENVSASDFGPVRTPAPPAEIRAEFRDGRVETLNGPLLDGFTLLADWFDELGIRDEIDAAADEHQDLTTRGIDARYTTVDRAISRWQRFTPPDDARAGFAAAMPRIPGRAPSVTVLEPRGDAMTMPIAERLARIAATVFGVLVGAAGAARQIPRLVRRHERLRAEYSAAGRNPKRPSPANHAA